MNDTFDNAKDDKAMTATLQERGFEIVGGENHGVTQSTVEHNQELFEQKVIAARPEPDPEREELDYTPTPEQDEQWHETLDSIRFRNVKDAYLHPGDVFFSRSETTLGKLIRFFTRAPGEARTKVNHVGVVVDSGKVILKHGFREAKVVEALERVRYGTLRAKYGGKEDQVVVYTPIHLSRFKRAKIAARAKKLEGRLYGGLKLPLHLLDWAVSQVARRDVYAFRRLALVGRYQICSYLVDSVFKGYEDFGVATKRATPDDLLDFIEGRSTKGSGWRVVMSLQRIPK